MRYLPLFLLLAGCASTWTKPGASEQDVAQARYECLQEARYLIPRQDLELENSGDASNSATQGMAVGLSQAHFMTDGKIMDACMAARGFTER